MAVLLTKLIILIAPGLKLELLRKSKALLLLMNRLGGQRWKEISRQTERVNLLR